MFNLANRCLHLGGYEDDMMWIFIKWYGKRCEGKRSYWFHRSTKLKFSDKNDVKDELFVVYNTKTEEGFKEFYDHHNISDFTKRWIWRNEGLSQSFRIMMMKGGYEPDVEDFIHVLKTNQIEVVHYIARQTLSYPFISDFWYLAQEYDNKPLLREFVDYVVREGLTDQMISVVKQSYQSVAKATIEKALAINKEVRLIRNSRPNDAFEEYAKSKKVLCYEAECLLRTELYRILKKYGYELSDRALLYHLEKEGAMAEEILSENRNYPFDALKIILSSKRLSALYKL
jgi:hypothetical protein